MFFEGRLSFVHETVIFSLFVLFFLCVGSPLQAVPLTDGYWHHPLAEQGEPPKGWPKLWKKLTPSSCASCHQEQYQAWQHSVHAHAFSPGLYGQFSKMSARSANACLNCHTPLAEQKFTTDRDLKKSLKNPKEHRLRNAGVSCAACHVRGWKRHGPPSLNSGKEGTIKREIHGGFRASKDFEKSQFCASCHQFPPSWGTVNGKALENTLNEWKASTFAREGVHCQQCHMPERQHLFKGIHDPEMTRKGLKIIIKKHEEGARLSITSQWIGHAFPTYITPKVHILAIAKNQHGDELQTWTWAIFRDVQFKTRWVEVSDTRLMPHETRDFTVGHPPKSSVVLVFRVMVEPDFYYKGLYETLLKSKGESQSMDQLQEALRLAHENDYMLFEGTVLLD